MSTLAPSAPASTLARTGESGAPSAVSAVPWSLWAVSFASTSIIVGAVWDISWHRTIGRDSFWTPAHMAIYLGGVVAGLSCGWLVLRTTFARAADAARERAGGVSFWGFRGPLGAWVCIWGALAMIVSAPLDDWWHNAYGLDVEILSPPHVVLAAGIYGIGIGAMLMALARQNVAGATQRMLQRLYVYAGGLLILMLATLFSEYMVPANVQHAPPFFFASAAIFPLLLIGISRGAASRWGATGAAAVYMGVTLLMIWILQLFPAQPMLAPIMRQVNHMVPPSFPLWIVAPAVVIDLVLSRLPGGAGRLRQCATAVAAAVAAVLALAAVQWPFAEFLLTEHARNFFFAGDQWSFDMPVGAYQYEFSGTPMTAAAAGWVAVVAASSGIAGMWWGNWMQRVRR